MNLALSSSENGSGNIGNLKLIEVLYHKAMRMILGIEMGQVKEGVNSRKEVRRRFGDSECVNDTWKRRKLSYLGPIVRSSRNACPPMIVTASACGRRLRSRPLRTAKDILVENIRVIVPELDYRGKHQNGLGMLNLKKLGLE